MVIYNISGRTLSFCFLAIILVFSFQNCSESGGDSPVTFDSASLSTVAVDMKYNGGPGIYEGAKVEFDSGGLDAEKYLLQWYYQSPGQQHGFPIDQANGNTYVINKIKLDQNGLYWLSVTDENGDRIISNKITVEVKPSQLKTQPTNKVVGNGGNVQFVAEVRNGSDVSYRWEWRRPGKPAFEPVPTNNSKITGAQDNVLLINGVEIDKHVAMYRLKITDKGSGDNANRVFYSQQVHLTVLKTNLPANKNNVALRSDQTLTFDAVGVKRTGNSNVALTGVADIQWERWDRNSDKFELVKSSGTAVTGKTLSFKASPRFTKYRARLLTKNNGVYYSRVTNMNYSGGYQEPWIDIVNIGARIEYTKRSNNKFDFGNSPTFLQSRKSVHGTADNNDFIRWHRKRPDDSAWVLIKDGDNNPFVGGNREIRGHWNDDTTWVEHRVYVQDDFGVRNYSNNVAIHNGGTHPSVTIRIPPGTEANPISRTLKTDIKFRDTAGNVISVTNHDVNLKWQRKNGGGGWDDMSSPHATEKTIQMKPSSPNLREYRVRFRNPGGNSGTLTNYHYFRIVKKQ